MASSHTPLAYFQVSPVRGQLEPYDGETRTGWRYLQCTDTPNELKVLLPPKTATLYAQLLQYETAELAKGKKASWDLILHIRHLKDRMIRKCQRISRLATPAVASGASAAFRIVHAPPDFRLKEMERWLRDQEPRGRTRDASKKYTVETAAPRPQTPQSSCSVCGHVHRSAHPHDSHAQTPSPRSSRIAHSASRSSLSQRAPTKASGSGKRRVSASSQSTSRSQSSSGSQRHPMRSAPLASQAAYLSPVVEERTGMSLSPSLSNPYGLTPEHAFDDPGPRSEVVSPEPLPHPYRSSTNLSEIPMEMPQPMTHMPEPDHYQPVFVDSREQSPPMAPDVQEGPPIAGSSLARPGIPRRRSSLKQSGRVSTGERSTKFDHIAYATEIAGNALDEARTKFQAEIIGVRDLRHNITAALERLRLETQTLQLEEQNLATHEERLNVSFEQLREKENTYKDTVAAVLEETKRVVMAADKKRDELLISLNGPR